MAETATQERYVETQLNYLRPNTTDSIYYTSDPKRGHLPLETRNVRIYDARPDRELYRLHDQGFQLIDAPTTVKDFRDRPAAAAVFLPEIERQVADALGAAKAVASGQWVHRFSDRAAEFGAAGTTYTARYIHIDYSNESGPSTARQLLGNDPEAERWMAGRFVILNTWRCLSPPPQDSSLALCEAGSVAAKDLIPSHVVVGPPGAERKLGTNMVEANPDHRWRYFSDMTRDELLIFRGYDSDPAHSRRIPHTAFDNPNVGPDAPPRESVDIRVAVFFG